MMNCSVPSELSTLESSGGHLLLNGVKTIVLKVKPSCVAVCCTEFLHVIITTLFETESTKNGHENANTNADIFQEASTSLSSTISACESSEVIVCIGVPVLCIPKKKAKKHLIYEIYLAVH
jgi:hypothetical protein